MTPDFHGAKLAILAGDAIVTILRDDIPTIPWPGYWDLPGGGREGAEGPLACALRETREEFGLEVPAAQVRWARAYTNSIGRTVWFLAGAMPEAAAGQVRLGEEGQGWDLFAPERFLGHARAVPPFKARLRDYLGGVMSDPLNERPPAD